MKSWERLDALLARVEQALLVFFLALMMVTAFSQIAVRNLFGIGLTWSEPLVRYLVLWVGFLGAALAVREGRHITIEVAVLSMVIGTVCGVGLALARNTRNRLARGFATVWIETARNTPALFQIYMIYFGLGSLGIFVDSFPALLIGTGLALASLILVPALAQRVGLGASVTIALRGLLMRAANRA